MARTKSKPESYCHWDLADADASHYETSCKHAFEFDDGTPRDNHFKFCPYCGLKLRASEVR